ncbi:TonB-dependent receptor plug domain-containing protein, partial [Desulfatiferula olefinivorans]
MHWIKFQSIRGLVFHAAVMFFIGMGFAASVTAEQYGTQTVTPKDPNTVIEAGTESETERSKVYMKIGEIKVTEKADFLETADLPASIDVIGADQIESQNVDFSMELLKKVPGAYYGDWNQGVISGTISMRGYDANHDVPVTLLVDGIPHNFGYGRMDIQPFFPLEIERMGVVKGTSDPRY